MKHQLCVLSFNHVFNMKVRRLSWELSEHSGEGGSQLVYTEVSGTVRLHTH